MSEQRCKAGSGLSGANAGGCSRVRGWVVVILGLGVGVLFWIWGIEDTHRQARHIQTWVTGLVVGVLLLFWLVLFSGLSWRLRWRVLVLVLGAVGLGALLFEIRGVTGDLVPIFQWRWSKSKPMAGPEPRRPAGKLPAQAQPIAFPQFLGPNRDGRLTGIRLARDWQAQGPVELWRRAVGAAWSGFAVQGRSAITQEQSGHLEQIVCYDLVTGQKVWVQSESARYCTTIAGEGPRATPTIDGERLFALGATGWLHCLSLADGRVIWKRDIVQENRAAVNEWGMSGSPLILSNWVVVSAGGAGGRSLVAYDKTGGDRAWSGGTDHAGYSSPQLAVLAGRPQILIFNAGALAAHEPGTGRVLWEFGWRKGHPHVAMPLVLPGDRVLVSSGYGTGSVLLQVKAGGDGGMSVMPVWKSMRLKAKFNNPVAQGGFIYGLDDGILVCLEAGTGQLKWKEGRYGHGQVLVVGDLLLVMAESGELLLLEASPAGHRVLSRFQALWGKTWNPPALAGPYLLVRNDREAAAFKLPTAPAAQEQHPKMR